MVVYDGDDDGGGELMMMAMAMVDRPVMNG